MQEDRALNSAISPKKLELGRASSCSRNKLGYEKRLKYENVRKTLTKINYPKYKIS